MKTVSFAVPCFNSAEYMDHCVETLLACGDDVEIILVDDGSTKDDTPAKVDEWVAKYPDIIRGIHQENGGHGAAVTAGLYAATGLYFKVVDSDDWLDPEAMKPIMNLMRKQFMEVHPIDMIIANYVYEKVHEGTQKVMSYRNVFPEGRKFGWSDIGMFHPSQYLLMHSVIYRTELLTDMKLELPRHCFYVDNVFVYKPLPHVKSMYYFDEDMYRYFIGREDQSVNEKVMMSRIDQQIRVTKTMIDAFSLDSVKNNQLRRYLRNDLTMMMTICTVFLRMRDTVEDDRKLEDLWTYLKRADPKLYRYMRHNVLTGLTNLPTRLGREIGLGGYRIAQKIFKFN